MDDDGEDGCDIYRLTNMNGDGDDDVNGEGDNDNDDGW